MRRATLIKRFLADERGAMSIMILPMFILLVVLGGLSLDVYIEETYREDLQDALDRGTLAAAAPHQSLDPATVVQAYVDTRTFNDTSVTANVVADLTATSSHVTASASYDMPTIIFSLFESNTMPVKAATAAFEGEEDVEISLVLDISGSMARETSDGTTQKRLAILRDAAKQFVTALLDRENAQKVSISMIPYAGQVNAGPLFDLLMPGGPTYANYAGKCVEFTNDDFTTAALPAAGTRAQTPQFQNFRYEADYGHEADWGWCPTDGSGTNTRGIVPFSRDELALHAAIDQFRGHDGTGTNNGVKWGVGLLDPSSQPLVQTLSDNGVVVADFADRPASYNATRTSKFMVVMTDGNIRYQNRPTSSYLSSTSWQDYWGGGPRKDSYGRTTNLLSRYASSRSILTSSTLRTLDEDLRSQQFMDICDIARDKGITVFTIGFDITTTQDAYTEMRDCATVPGNFFDVDGLDLFAAFQQINSFIKKLQLTL